MGRIFLSPVPFREACSRRLLVGFRGPWRRIKEDDDDAALRIFSVSPSTLLSLSVYSPLESSFQLLSFGFRFSLPFLPRPDCIADRVPLLSSFQSRGRGGLLFLFNCPPRDSFCFPFPPLKTSRRVLFRESLRRFIIFPPAEEKLSHDEETLWRLTWKTWLQFHKARSNSLAPSISFGSSFPPIQFLRLQIPKQSLLRVLFPLDSRLSRFLLLIFTLATAFFSLQIFTLKIVSKRFRRKIPREKRLLRRDV